MSILGWSRRAEAREADADTREIIFNERELFYRDLSEVHLLIDFVSGRTDRSLMGLKDIVISDAKGKPMPALPPQRVIEEICKISYPPEGSRAATAHQAAFMLLVKDRLNYLASPARGLTVAFTSMFAGVALDLRFDLFGALMETTRLLGHKLLDRETAEEKQKKAAAAKAEDRDKHPTEQELADARAKARRKRDFYSAQAAYPNLEQQARRFRTFYNFLPFMAVLLVSFIVYVNWDVSVTGSVLENIADAQCSYDALSKAPQACTPAAATDKRAPTLHCATLQACADVVTSNRRTLADLVGGARFLHPIALSFRVLGVAGDVGSDTPPPPTPENIAEPWRLESFTRAVIVGLNGIIIPTAFGWLGTLAGLMRSITTKVRDSVLAPRDYTVALIGMCLGMSAGLAVGLFVSDQTLQGSQPLGKTITITSAGLSFLAGFGAEAFFTFLDSLLVRLLPSSASAPPK